MRTYGRVTDKQTGLKSWAVVQTAPNGDNSEVWITTLCQVLLLYLNESPFYANYGIPARSAVSQQIPPDFYVAATQAQFAPRFANLTITKRQDLRVPTYTVKAITNQGAELSAEVAV